MAVTLEIADATLGGLAMGVGMTTYSHKVHINIKSKKLNMILKIKVDVKVVTYIYLPNQ